MTGVYKKTVIIHIIVKGNLEIIKMSQKKYEEEVGYLYCIPASVDNKKREGRRANR